jgi:hypothetical protein
MRRLAWSLLKEAWILATTVRPSSSGMASKNLRWRGSQGKMCQMLLHGNFSVYFLFHFVLSFWKKCVITLNWLLAFMSSSHCHRSFRHFLKLTLMFFPMSSQLNYGIQFEYCHSRQRKWTWAYIFLYLGDANKNNKQQKTTWQAKPLKCYVPQTKLTSHTERREKGYLSMVPNQRQQ